MSVRFRPNLSLPVALAVVTLWELGLISFLVSCSLFVAYILIASVVLWRNPKIKRDAQDFAQQVARNRERRRLELTNKILQNSAQFSRKIK